MASRQLRQTAVAPQLTGLWVPYSPCKALLQSLQHSGLAAVAAVSQSTLQHIAAVTSSLCHEPWSATDTGVLFDFLSSMFTQAIKQKFVLSFHGRIFAKPQMAAVSVDACDIEGKSPVMQGIPFANVTFASSNSNNAVEVSTGSGTMTVTSRSKALLFASGLLDAEGEPLYCLAIPNTKGASLHAKRQSQPWLLCWTLNAVALSDRLSPPLNGGLTHSRSNVKRRLEPLQLMWQPPMPTFLNSLPSSMLALDPRQPFEYGVDIREPKSFAALPAYMRQLETAKLAVLLPKGEKFLQYPRTAAPTLMFCSDSSEYSSPSV
jgi:hypothetical protein